MQGKEKFKSLHYKEGNDNGSWKNRAGIFINLSNFSMDLCGLFNFMWVFIAKEIFTIL